MTYEDMSDAELERLESQLGDGGGDLGLDEEQAAAALEEVQAEWDRRNGL